jgi:hypothetical protein
VTPAEVTALCRYVAAACPGQSWDEFTPDVWAEIIPPDFTLAECRSAVIALKRRQKWIDVSDILAEVRRDRRPAAEARRLSAILGGGSYRGEVVPAEDARTRAALDRIRARTGYDGFELRAVPPPDYDDPGGGEGAA